MHAGSLIAAGLDCDIFQAGPGKIIRRAREGRSLEREASVMRHAWRNGFPVPQVFDADGPDILMEHVEGTSMRQEAAERPERMPGHGRLLGELLRRLAAVRAPGWLQAADGCPGNRLLHLDLHPANVLLTADGPRVIDWANAARGASGADTALTWLILAAAPVGDPAVAAGREGLLEGFRDGADIEAARPYLRVMGERRRADGNVTAGERAAIDRFLTREAPAPAGE
ncbi:phosphotransferase, partial [Nonomuraea sp. RK-328]|nr:phosphotransferase [Nonomuraea sp. RK-328]